MRQKSKFRLSRFLARFAIAFLAIVFCVPLFFLLVYKIEAVHPVSTLMMRDWVIGPGVKREWVELDDMAPVLYQSVMMSEDGRFCEHYGVDWQALNDVIEDAIDGERPEGPALLPCNWSRTCFFGPTDLSCAKGWKFPTR